MVQEIIEFLNVRPKLYQCFEEYKTLEVTFPKGAWQSYFFTKNRKGEVEVMSSIRRYDLFDKYSQSFYMM